MKRVIPPDQECPIRGRMSINPYWNTMCGWDFITALRGPDIGDGLYKSRFTEFIRRSLENGFWRRPTKSEALALLAEAQTQYRLADAQWFEFWAGQTRAKRRRLYRWLLRILRIPLIPTTPTPHWWSHTCRGLEALITDMNMQEEREAPNAKADPK